jgi:CRP-like cAMP-binding protein
VPIGNALLDSLPNPELQMLRPHLLETRLSKDSVLIDSDEASSKLYFPTAGLISCMGSTSIGEQVEIYAAGAHDVIGLLGRADQPWRAKVQIAGGAAAVERRIFFQLLPSMERFRQILFHYIASVMQRIGRRVSCVRFHSTSARVCLWLALAAQITSTAELETTHQSIADALGSRRATVTVVMGELERERVVRGQRGHIQILDRPGLEALACECLGFLR